jgi:hypothetical protein
MAMSDLPGPLERRCCERYAAVKRGTDRLPPHLGGH